MKILGFCGSLRENSSNASLLKAAQIELAGHEWSTIEIAKLPYFEPDLQYSENTPKIVTEFRLKAEQSDLIFVATPEYAHGIPGVLKNAFEWIFHEGTQRKPVYVVIGSGQGENSKTQLIEILSTMDFSISENQILLFKGARNAFVDTGKLNEGSSAEAFRNFCKRICADNPTSEPAS